jgi:hypothetical protein
MLETLCAQGLPNFSRPGVVRADDLGCNVLGSKRRVTGVLLSGFEAANLMTHELGPGNTWFTCNQIKGCDYGVGDEVGKKTAEVCGTSLVTLVVDGWPTVSRGRYGHMGGYSREFFMDRIVAVLPPPKSEVDQWKDLDRQIGFTDEDCKRMR